MAAAGPDCAVPEPCIIVRLLILRRSYAPAAEFFTVPTHRGLDLPTLRLGSGTDLLSMADGLATLATRTLGRPDVGSRCVGYVRNVVPDPDDGYPYPAPWAHVPVFVVTEDVEPVIDGSWLTLLDAASLLSTRHWWPIAEHHLAGG